MTDSPRRAHALTPGVWPGEFPVTADGRVEEGLPVWSISGRIEGRTTGSRLRCYSIGCPGWFIGVIWETGQGMRPCSEGWHFAPATRTVRINGGGEISARFVSPRPLGTNPLPASEWPKRSDLAHRRGWRVSGLEPTDPPLPVEEATARGCKGTEDIPGLDLDEP
jgi:hypothetical protein